MDSALILPEPSRPFPHHSPSRRRFLQAGVALAASAAVPAWARGGRAQTARIDTEFWLRPRRLWLHRPQSGETLDVVYWQDGLLQEDAYWKICSLMRDLQENLTVPISVDLLDVMRGIYGFYENAGYRRPYILTSGYRTVKTNQKLSKEGAVRNSYHLYGRASDGYIEGVPVRDIAALGLWFRQGGVGMYTQKNFVHIDDGRLRFWRG
jgi:uncharacterized protein YcbK (DUF882 family)